MAPTVVGSRWWTDLLGFLFVPYSLFTLTWLPTQRAAADEDAAAFANRVQRLVAGEARLQPTRSALPSLLHLSKGKFPSEYTSVDAVEFAKRWLVESERRQRQAHFLLFSLCFLMN